MQKFLGLIITLLVTGCSTGYIQQDLETVDALIQTEEKIYNGDPADSNGQLKAVTRHVPVKIIKPKSLKLN